jgi:hypothetical protein
MHFLRASVGATAILLALGCGKSGEKSGAANPPTPGNGPGGIPVVPGEPDDSVETALPPVPRLPGLSAGIVGGSVNLSVVPVAGAKDYRVYVLPSDDAISATEDGHVAVRNAIYRCAGDRQASALGADENVKDQIVRTQVDNQTVSGFPRTLADATLGHVYVQPGDGRIPVYALGDPGESADNRCFGQRWNESRVKRHVTSAEERAQLIAQMWRDDGIVFYIPAPGTPGTKPIYSKQEGNAHLYYVDGPEAQQRGAGTVPFNVLAEPGTDTQPLMRVHYTMDCGQAHDEIVAGAPRFERARYQGDKLPLWDLHWSGITAETTLVVEALDEGCPYGGAIGPSSRPAGKEDNVDYPAFITLEEAVAASPTGEVFLNGHHAAANRPRPIARSFVKVAPAQKPKMDWFTGFDPDETLPDFASLPWDAPCGKDNCLAEYRQQNDLLDMTFGSVTSQRFAAKTVLGELWVMYADVGADVAGKFRMTPNVKATVSADMYLHVTMEASSFTTARRYPQILISDAEVPVQWNLPKANTVIIETFPDAGAINWPVALAVQVCDHRAWEVNDQCPAADLYRLRNAVGKVIGLAPTPEVAEYTGVDRSTRFDVYMSSKRTYLFVDSRPYGCLDLPAKGVPSGPVNVTFGDVLYHSGVDPVFAYYENNLKVASARHYDNLGFKSGVPDQLGMKATCRASPQARSAARSE